MYTGYAVSRSLWRTGDVPLMEEIGNDTEFLIGKIYGAFNWKNERETGG
jgi:hypothetical protein